MRTWIKIAARLIGGIAPNGTCTKLPGFSPCCERSTHFVSFDSGSATTSSVCRAARSPRAGSDDRHRKALPAVEEPEHTRVVSPRPQRLGSALPSGRRLPGHPVLPGSADRADRLGVPQHQSRTPGFRRRNLRSRRDPGRRGASAPHPGRAFQEIHRTLRPGGAHNFTVPIVNRHRPSEKWAELSPTGEVKFLASPDYHGNPVDPQGSPVMTR